jgi:hypothetical protein
MAFGARQFGSRSFGDSTTYAGNFADIVYGSATLAGAATMTATAGTPTNGSASLAGSASLTAAGQLKVEASALLEGRASLSARTPLVITTDPSAQKVQYRVIVVDYQGNRYADLEQVDLSNITWELNGIHTADFTLPLNDPKAVHLKTPEREVQIWRGNRLLTWMVITSMWVEGATIRVQCKGLRWYFSRRFFGKADRTNYVKNGSFEQGLAYWDFFYNVLEPQANLTHSNYTASISTAKTVVGSKSLKITDQNATPQFGISATQVFIMTVDDAIDPEGTIWTLAVWVYVEDFQSSDRRAGVTIQRSSTTQTVTITRPGGTPTVYPKVISATRIPIDEDTPKGVWTRMEIEMTQPFRNDQPEFVLVRITSPKGIIYIDEVTLTAAEKTSFYDKDQALIVKGIVDHCQDTNYGKSSLNMQTNTPLTGIIRTREYWHSEHQVCADALNEFHSLYQGVDSEITVTPTTRTYTTYYPRKGIHRPDTVLEHGKNIAAYSVEYSGEETANSVVVLGDGEGSDREEGGAIDNTSLGGLILEKVYNATPGSHIKTLDQQAQRGVERFKKPVVIPQITTYDNRGDLLETLQVGDVVPVRIQQKINVDGEWVDGFVQINEDYRIMAISLDPKADQILFTINPAATSF